MRNRRDNNEESYVNLGEARAPGMRRYGFPLRQIAPMFSSAGSQESCPKSLRKAGTCVVDRFCMVSQSLVLPRSNTHKTCLSRAVLLACTVRRTHDFFRWYSMKSEQISPLHKEEFTTRRISSSRERLITLS